MAIAKASSPRCSPRLLAAATGSSLVSRIHRIVDRLRWRNRSAGEFGPDKVRLVYPQYGRPRPAAGSFSRSTNPKDTSTLRGSRIVLTCNLDSLAKSVIVTGPAWSDTFLRTDCWAGVSDAMVVRISPIPCPLISPSVVSR
ncbi:hypothetical protein HMPREF9586_01254 [Cutibacterium acnes HL083PA2]|nr:hypothetical protein HMPREF9586_01254 [Cutibacterium acnes HL083PA2]